MSDWEDDDYDADKALEEAEKARRKKENSEEDDDSEEEREKARAEEARKANLAKAKPKPKKKAEPDYDVPLLDAKAEKARRQKLVEEADARLAADLFAGVGEETNTSASSQAKAGEAEKKPAEKKEQVVTIDAFDKLELTTTADVDKLTETCLKKLTDGKAKNCGQKFLTDMLKALEKDLDMRDLETFNKAVADLLKLKKLEKTTAAADKADKKGTKKLDNGAVRAAKPGNFNASDELAVVYGGGGGDWEDWDEDWDDWDGAAEYYKKK